MSVPTGFPLPAEDQSLISALYRHWEAHSVPALFYHYSLSVLSGKPKASQIALMALEIRQLQLGKHRYQQLAQLVATREQALELIVRNAELLGSVEEEQIQASQALQHEYQREYHVVYRSRAKGRLGSRRFFQLIQHIRIFRKITVELVFAIYQWMKELRENQYQGLIQFLHKNQDYIEKIAKDTREVVAQHSVLFESNPLLIVRQEHEKTEYALIYQCLRIEEEEALRIGQVLQLIKVHLATLEKKRLEGMFKQSGSRKTLRAANHFETIYLNFNSNTILANNYRTTSKGQLLKADTFLVNPEGSKELTKNTFFRKPAINRGSRLASLERSKSQVLIHQAVTEESKVSKANHKGKAEEPPEHSISLHFETGIAKESIFSYLKYQVFKEKSAEKIQPLAKLLIREKDSVSLIKVRSGELLVAWMAVIFNPKDQLFQRVADIIYLQKFMKAPALLAEITERFVSLGYGVVKEGGTVVFEQKYFPNKIYSLINLEWRVSRSRKDEVKGLVKDYQNLKSCRLLKYYTYSRQSKYHKYCLHKQNSCRLSLQFDFVSQVSIEGKMYFKAKCGKVERVGPLWRIEHPLNPLHILLAKAHQHIRQYEKRQGKGFGEGSSASDNCDSDEMKSFVCFPHVKSIKKYVNADQEQVIFEKFNISQQVSEVLSISKDKISMKNCLIVEEKWILALVCSNEEDFGKSVAVVELK